MKISKEYQSRHGFADFENNTFKITNAKNETTIDCELIKVPTYSFKHTYKEKISEGNGWYTIGDTITETITHDFYWIVVLNNECLGVVNHNSKKSLSTKYSIQNFNGLKYVKEFVKSYR
jgi:hypothetical protein